MNNPDNLIETLKRKNEIIINEDIRKKAFISTTERLISQKLRKKMHINYMHALFYRRNFIV